MAGHSKWAKVKPFKGAIDAQRGKIFSQLSREITIATKVAGGWSRPPRSGGVPGAKLA